MRASPRTWPSIRPSLFSVAALASRRMPSIYPPGVFGSSERTMSDIAQHNHDHAVTGRVLDPVCGMTDDPQTAKHRHDHNSHTYCFISSGFHIKFAADPVTFLYTHILDPESMSQD